MATIITNCDYCGEVLEANNHKFILLGRAGDKPKVECEHCGGLNEIE